MPAHLALRSGRWLQYANATTAVTMDGNSLVFGYRNPGPGNTIAQQIVSQSTSPLYGSGITVTNLGVSGQTWQDMLSGLPSFVVGKTNVLICWEGTNAIASGNGTPKTAAQAIAQQQAYIDAVKAANAAWKIVGMTCLPRQGGFSSWGSIAALNAQIDEYNATLLSTYRTMGMDALCDVRQTGGVFDMSGDYSNSQFDACNARTGSTVWLEPTTGSAIHMTDAGDAVIATMLASTLRRIRP
jgi:hypothetical protein